MSKSKITELPKKTDEELKQAQEAAEKERQAAKEAKVSAKLAAYPMRELESDDLFEVLEICERLNVADLVIEFLAERDKSSIKAQQAKGLAVIAAKDTENLSKVQEMQSKITDIQNELSESSFEIVGKIVKLVLSNISVIRPELNGLLAKLTDKTPEDIGEMKLVTYVLLIKSFFAKPELKELYDLLL